MNTIGNAFRRYSVYIFCVAVVLTMYGFARLPEMSAKERSAISSHFKFSRALLPEVYGYPPRYVRDVHPSLAHIKAWISSVGASVALNNFDGDGLPNDVCYVNVRTNRVIIAPVPGTGDRFDPFDLAPMPLPYDPWTMAPMGCLPGDVNEDGLMDLVVYYWGRTPVAFIRKQEADPHQTPLNGKKYVPCEIVPGGERWFSNAATFADLDGDGHLDLVVGNYFQDGARILDAKDSGKVQVMQDSMSLAFNGGRHRLMLWKAATGGLNPSVRFDDQPGVLSDDITHGWTLAVGAADLDGDLLPELYFANDFGPDRLLYNLSKPGQLRFATLEGKSSFTTPKSKVLGRDSFKGMGVDFTDLNGDGVADILVSNIATQFALEESHFVFMSTDANQNLKNGEVSYVDRSEQLGLSRSGWGWDIKAGDFDNDGVSEVIQAVGFLKGHTNRWPELHEVAMGNDQLLRNPLNWHHFQVGDDLGGQQHNPFYVRSASGRYYDIAAQIGLDQPQVTRGIALADVNGDGRLDFATGNQWEYSYFYLNESSASGAFLGLHLRLPLSKNAVPRPTSRAGHPGIDTPGRPAVGAVASVELAGGRRLAAQVDGGNGHSGKRSPDLLFGLGELAADANLRVVIRWRDPEGLVREDTLRLTPGWHTVTLGWQ
jgi:enediyne biosynthesis protein E4